MDVDEEVFVILHGACRVIDLSFRVKIDLACDVTVSFEVNGAVAAALEGVVTTDPGFELDELEAAELGRLFTATSSAAMRDPSSKRLTSAIPGERKKSFVV